MNLRLLVSFLLFASLALVPAEYAAGSSFGFTDTQLGGTSQIAYSLGLTGGACPPDCTMTVTINVSGTPSPNTTPVYLASLVFKFGGSSLLDLDAVGAETLPTGIPNGWNVVKDADVDNTATSNLHNGAVPNGGFVGFYNTNLTTNLVNLSSAGTFTFTFDAHGVNLSSNPSLHNEYYTLSGSAVNFDTFLSVTAGPVTPVSEHSSSFILLAITVLAMAGTVAWRNATAGKLRGQGGYLGIPFARLSRSSRPSRQVRRKSSMATHA
jgi:hypothetical protein